MAKVPTITIVDIRAKLVDKLDEAEDFLQELERTKKDHRLFHLYVIPLCSML
jgi:hypothetical protein